MAPIVVIKVGTSSLVDMDVGTPNPVNPQEGAPCMAGPVVGNLRLSNLAKICEAVKGLRARGYSVILVSSGAVGVGCHKMGLSERPQKMSQKQAVAAVGQPHLMGYYHDFFTALGMTCAQVLLTNDNFAQLTEYLNAQNTLNELLKYGTVPVVNENDTVAVDQLRIGDNDTLSAKVAIMVEASWLFLLTDVDCLYTANPRLHPDAQPIHEVPDIQQLQVDVGSGTQWGSGGMATKLTAARLVTAAGSKLAICRSTMPEAILKIMNGEPLGTVFHNISAPLSSKKKERKQWILSVPVKGQLWMDSGAVKAVLLKRASLFAVGITRVIGDFGDMDAVSLCKEDGTQFGIGLANYSHKEMRNVKGKKSHFFSDELIGYISDEMVHRQNICLLGNGDGNECAGGDANGRNGNS